MTTQTKRSSDYTFKFRGRPKSYSALVEYHATLSRACGPLKTDRELAGAVTQLVRRWRMRLVDLRDHGWKMARRKKFAWYRNCAPCGVKTDHIKARGCGTRPCPFCHARRVADIYKMVWEHIAQCQLESMPLRFYSYQRTIGVDPSTVVPIMEDPEHCQKALDVLVLPAAAEFRRVFAKQVMSKVMGGVYSCTIEPSRYKRRDGDHVGRWLVHHNAILMTHEHAEPPQAVGDLRMAKSLDPRTLAWFIGSTFRYPLGMLSGPVDAAVVLLNSTEGKRQTATFGELRKSH